MFGHTLRGWLAESLELVTSRTTFPYKITIWNLLILMVLLIIIGLTLLKVVIIKLSFICFYFFFSMKVRHVHCVWSQFLYSPSLHDLQNIKCHFVNGQLAVGSFFVRSQLRSDLASEKFKHLRDFLETSNFLIYRLTLNIGNFGSNASINDAWHKKVNNMEM